jgi:hypothetical protein
MDSESNATHVSSQRPMERLRRAESCGTRDTARASTPRRTCIPRTADAGWKNFKSNKLKNGRARTALSRRCSG